MTIDKEKSTTINKYFVSSNYIEEEGNEKEYNFCDYFAESIIYQRHRNSKNDQNEKQIILTLRSYMKN